MRRVKQFYYSERQGTWRHSRQGVLAIILAATLSACSMIDDDLSNCLTPQPEEETSLDYELQLVTNMTTEVQTQLTAQTDVELAATLTEHLSDIFTDFAHDVDLSFYSTEGSFGQLYHDEHIMDASEHSYTLYIPRQKYMHIAVANVIDDPIVYLDGADNLYTATLRQAEGDTIDSHTTGIFTARQLMEMIEGINQTFNVKLYMANCSAMLVVDPRGHDISGMRVFTTGFATAFHIADSVYEFKTPSPLIRTKRLDADSNGNVGFCSVNFPSREPSTPANTDAEGRAMTTTRSVIETTEPFIAQPGEEALWEFRIYQPQEDGTVTETILGIREPLRAGQLKIVRCWLNADGSLGTKDHTVGVSVTLDWHKGGHFNPEF